MSLVERAFGPALDTELERVLGEPLLDVSEPKPLTGGASRETWALDARAAGRVHELILRRDPPGAHRPGLELESAAFRAAHRAGVPAPRVLATGTNDGPLGYPFILSERIPGETLGRRILRDAQFDAVRPTLAARCGEILARIHAIDPAEIPRLPRIDALATLRDKLDFYADPLPLFELGYAWLRDHRPASGQTVVHGDFRNGNLIVGQTGSARCSTGSWSTAAIRCRTSATCACAHGASVASGRSVASAPRGSVCGLRAQRPRASTPRPSAGGRCSGPCGGASACMLQAWHLQGLQAFGRAGRDRPARVGAGVRRAAGGGRGMTMPRDPDHRGAGRSRARVPARRRDAGDPGPAPVPRACRRERARAGRARACGPRASTAPACLRARLADDAELAAAIRDGLSARPEPLLGRRGAAAQLGSPTHATCAGGHDR